MKLIDVGEVHTVISSSYENGDKIRYIVESEEEAKKIARFLNKSDYDRIQKDNLKNAREKEQKLSVWEILTPEQRLAAGFYGKPDPQPYYDFNIRMGSLEEWRGGDYHASTENVTRLVEE